MKYLLWIVGLFAAAVALTSAAAHNTAYVLFVYPPYRIELSLALFILLSVLGFVLMYGLVRLTFTVMQLPAQVRAFRVERAQKKARALLEEVLSAYFEGRYAAAEKAAERAMEMGETSALYTIIAARAAHELRDFKKRDAYLAAAEGKTIGDTTMRLMAAGKFMLDQRNPRAALEALQQLRDSGVRGHSGALALELRAYQQAGNWDEVLNVLDQLEKRDAIDATMADQLRQQAWLEKLRQQEDIGGLMACLKKIPSDIKRRSKVAATAAQALIRHDGGAQAQQLLTDSLNARWDSELVALYGDCLSDDGMVQIEQAEKWLKLHTQDAGLLLALGKLCLHQKLWGKAQSYLEASNSIAPSHAAYTALGQLAERLGKSGEASGHYRQAMVLGERKQ